MSLTKLRWYIALSKPIKPTQSIFKRPNKEILLSMMLDNSDVRYTNQQPVNHNCYPILTRAPLDIELGA